MLLFIQIHLRWEVFKIFFWHFGPNYQQTFQLKSSVFISEVCHVIENYHVTNVEERRIGPGPNCKTERTGAPLSVQGCVLHPFPYGFLYSPPTPITFFIQDLNSLWIQRVSCVLQVTINCWILSRIGVRPLMLFQPGSDGLKSLSHRGFDAALPFTGNTMYKVGTLLKRLFVFKLEQLLS